MATACQSIPSPESFAPGMIAFLDCQAQSLGSLGYQALAAPGSIASALLTAMVTIVIALIGYRLLLGYAPSVRDGVLTIVKIGLVLALATSWPAYQIVIYDLILRTPAELASAVGGAAGLPGATGGLVDRLDGVDQALKALAIQGVGAPPVGADGNSYIPDVAPSPFLGFDSFALGFARVGFLVGALGAFALVRILAGLLLALGPVFAVFLLFDGTRGLFEGWARALIGTALAAFATAIVLGVELAFLEPWLAALLARRAAGLDILGVPAQLLGATTIFGIALLGVVIAVARVAGALRVPAWHQAMGSIGASPTTGPDRVTLQRSSAIPLDNRSRAGAVADAVALSQRREAALPGNAGTGSSLSGPSGSNARGRVSSEGMTISPSRSSASRRTGHRVSARATARDRRP